MKRMKRVLCLFLAVLTCLSVLPITASAADANPAELTNPSISPVYQSKVWDSSSNQYCYTYSGQRSSAVSAASDGSFTVKWSSTESKFYFAVKILSGSPNLGEDEPGTAIVNNANYTSKSYKISATNMANASGKWIKVYLKGTNWNCHYYFKVASPSHSDLEDEGPADMVDTLESPDDVYVTALDSNRIKVEWEKVSGATGYKVYRSSKSTKSSFTTVVATITKSSTLSYIDTGLSPNTKYYYRVTATKGSVESELSDYDYDTTDPLGPAAPESISVSVQDSSSIKVSWSKVTGATGYKVYRSSSSSKSSFTNAIATITGGSTTSYIDKGLTANTRYYYRVTAFDNNYESELSDYDYDWTDEEVTAVAAPVSVSATTRSVDRIEITWGKVADASGYKVYRSTGSTVSSAVCIKEISGNSVLSYMDSDLPAGTTYWYWVKAVKNGEESNFSNRTNATTAEVAKLATPSISPVYKQTVSGGSGNYVATYYGKSTTTVPNDTALSINWVDTEGSYKLAIKVLDGEPDMVNFNDSGTPIYNATTSCSYVDNVYPLEKDVIVSAAGKWIKVYLGCDYWNCHYYFKVAPKVTNETVSTDLGNRMAEYALSLVGTSRSKLTLNTTNTNWCASFVVHCANHLGLVGDDKLFADGTYANPWSIQKNWKAKVYYYYEKDATYTQQYSGSTYTWTFKNWTSQSAKKGADVDFFMSTFDREFDPNRSYNPAPGDLVYFKCSPKNADTPNAPWAHVGIITNYDKTTGKITFVDGNNHGNGNLTGGTSYGSTYVNKRYSSKNDVLIMAIAHPYYSQFGTNPGNLKLSTSAVTMEWGKDNEAPVTISGTTAYTTSITYDGLTEAQKTTYNNWDWLKCTASGNTIWVRTKYPNYANTARKATVTVKTDNNSISFTVTQNKCGEDAPKLRSVKTIKENLGDTVTLSNGYDLGTLKNGTLPLTIETTNVRRITIQTKKYGSATVLYTTPATISNEDGTNKVDVQLVDGAGKKLADGKYQLDIWYSNSATENDKWSQYSKHTVYFSIGEQSQQEPDVGTTAGYNPAAALSYAFKYNKKHPGSFHNPDYTYYTNNDCANFVSQCLEAGGLKTDSTWKPYTSAWYSCHALISYLEQQGYTVYGYNSWTNNVGSADRKLDISKIKPGDLIFCKNANGAVSGHAMIVERVSGNAVYYHAHTNERCGCTSCNECIAFTSLHTHVAMSENTKNVPVTSVKITQMANGTSFKVGDNINLIATVYPSDATNKTVTWTSSNTSVASVNSSGVVTAKSAGTVKITATAGSVTGTWIIRIDNIATGDHLPGDVNGDGKVNNKDVRQLAKYLVNKKIVVVVEACDINGDGKLNNKDVRLLAKYLVNKNIKIY